MGFWKTLFGLNDAPPAPAAPVAPRATPMTPERPAASDANGMYRIVPPAPGKIAVPSPDGMREYDITKPFWASAAKLQPGTFAKYESVDHEWHVFQIEGGLEYGRDAVPYDVSLVVRRVSTAQEFTMPVHTLHPCDPAFAQRDGTRIRRGESMR